ncbi:MAG TPA: DUF72 domain-containing protein [Humisphaera sp.]|jgi:uncharacterized protein YecE (DUF72 family)|nr:DUF72 domain-containing protein [Humisphaera sp.]
MRYRLGTIGFSYPEWVGGFYPRDLKATEYLSFYARYFDCVELDTTFHAVPPAATVRRWAAQVPDDFRFAVKCPRTVTHEGRIDAQISVMSAFLDVMRELGGKLGPVLLQFPPSFRAAELDRLSAFLGKLPRVRYAVEFRHDSWLNDRTTAMLKEQRVCWAVGDYATPPEPVRVTTDFLFIRWIGIHHRFERLDIEQIDVTDRLRSWKTQFEQAPAGVKEIWAFVNNDFSGYAIGTANRMKRLLGLPASEPKAEDRGELFG